MRVREGGREEGGRENRGLGVDSFDRGLFFSSS